MILKFPLDKEIDFTDRFIVCVIEFRTWYGPASPGRSAPGTELNILIIIL